jgi:hypothetical protein
VSLSVYTPLFSRAWWRSAAVVKFYLLGVDYNLMVNTTKCLRRSGAVDDRVKISSILCYNASTGLVTKERITHVTSHNVYFVK